ncbi:MAG: hypothetical protein M1840_009135 [Geoglossum simile]|nr:MAG: hypothetical protein M1840_009135 [Geoglossum simile]
MSTNSSEDETRTDETRTDETRTDELERAKKSKRGKRNEWEKKSRENAKRLKLNPVIEWGHYDPDFPTSGTAAELELHDFLQRLEKVSTFAATRADSAARLLAAVRKMTKLEILSQLDSALPSLPQDDLILLTDGESLRSALSQPFRIPLLHRAANHPSLGPCPNVGIQDLLEHLAEDKEASISVCDYDAQESLQKTRETTVRELLECFQSGNTRGAGLSFIDIENRTKIQFCPFQIILQDISNKIEALKPRNWGRTESEWKAEVPKEFFVASMKRAISTIHVDTGGAVSWDLILEGRQIWYFPRHVTTQTVRWLGHTGSQNPEDYEGGWVKAELCRGDLLVMPPNFPHAVFTPENSLTVGGRVYTSGTLGRSIEGLKMQEDNPSISHEDLHDCVYNTLARTLRECDAVTTSAEKAQIISSCSLFPDPPASSAARNLSKSSLIDILGSHGISITSRPKKAELLQLIESEGVDIAAISGTPVEPTPREKFLDAALTFCRGFTDGDS